MPDFFPEISPLEKDVRLLLSLLQKDYETFIIPSLHEAEKQKNKISHIRMYIPSEGTELHASGCKANLPDLTAYFYRDLLGTPSSPRRDVVYLISGKLNTSALIFPHLFDKHIASKAPLPEDFVNEDTRNILMLWRACSDKIRISPDNSQKRFIGSLQPLDELGRNLLNALQPILGLMDPPERPQKPVFSAGYVPIPTLN